MNEIPILPVSLDGTRLLSDMDTLARTPRGQRLVRMRVAPPLTAAHQSARENKQVAEELRQLIMANREAIRVTWPATPAQAGPAATGADPADPAAGRP